MASSSRLWYLLIPLAFATLFLTAGIHPVFAQLQSGNLHGKALSSEAEALPGVAIEISGVGASLTQITDTAGQFRFLGLAPGSYRLEATLDGFSPIVLETVTVAVGRNTSVEVTMTSAIQDLISVTAESPLLDERRISTGATVTRTELESVPTARDPWVILQSIPGVLTNDVNVGGNKSGYQQLFTGSGSLNWSNTYSLDGVLMNDPGYFNSAATYFGFGSLEEIEVSTGGSDASVIGGGVTLSLVTRRGTNDWRGSALYLIADDAWQSDLTPDSGDLGAGQDDFDQGNRIIRLEEYGFEGGGPLIHDRFWLWGHYGKNDIDRLTVADGRDFTQLEFYGIKLNGQLSHRNSAVLFWTDSGKSVDGRGAGPTRAPLATWDQWSRPGGLFKLEDTHIFGPQLFLSGLISYFEGPWGLTPKGGIDGVNAILDENFVWQENFLYVDEKQYQKQGSLDSNYFINTGELDHEIRGGAAYRQFDSDQPWGWPGDAARYDFYRSFGAPYNRVAINRQQRYPFTTESTSLFLQDTLRVGKLTANVGLRYDYQTGHLNAASVPGVPGFEYLPDGTPLMPAVSVAGRDQSFSWGDLLPRLGLTWALDSERQTLLRASYSRFSTPMHQWYASLEWPVGPATAEFYYEDSNGDGLVTVDEVIDFEDGPLATNGYDPLAQEGLADIDPGFSAALSDEVILGVEHAFLPELVVGLSTTWRNQQGIDEYERLVVEEGVERTHLRSDYELRYVQTVDLPDGTTRDVEVYGFRDDIEETGRLFVTNGERETDYLGVNLTLHKRLSQRWMLRGFLSWSDWTWTVPESERDDPNFRHDTYAGALGAEGAGLGPGFDDDDGPVFQQPITAGWSYRLGGLVQIAPDKPWGFDIAGNVWGRQGYAIDYYTTEFDVFVTEPQLDLQAVRPLDDYRLPDLHLVDLRLQKPVSFGDFEAVFSIDCFNALNESTVLQRNIQLGISTTDWVQEIVNPRIFRLGVRVNWR